MITRTRIALPHVLMLERGGSVAAAQRISGEVLQELAEAGVVASRGLEARVVWIAVTMDKDEAMGRIDWDPTEPIPVGSVELHCHGFSVSIEPES